MRRGLLSHKALHRSNLMWGMAVWLAAVTVSAALPIPRVIAQEKKDGTVLRVPPGDKLRASISGMSREATVAKLQPPEPLLTAVALDDWSGYVRDVERSRPFSTSTSISDLPRKLLIVAGDSLKDVIPTILADFSRVHKYGSDHLEDPWYRVIATSSQTGGAGDIPLDKLWSNGWLRLSEVTGIPPQELQKKPAMLIVAGYLQGELPGVKRYGIRERAGSSSYEGSWLLEKGSSRGQIRFVREAGEGEFETIKMGIVGERVYVEIEFEVAPSLESIDVEIGRNGQIQKLGGPDTSPYLKLSGPYPSGSKDGTIVRRLGMMRVRMDVPGMPPPARIYRSGPVALWDANRAGAPEGSLIAVRPGDKVQAQLADLSIGTIVPRVGSILVKHQPDLEWTWPVAVARAANALGRGVGDLKKSSREEIARLSNSTITAGTWTTTVRLGDLAAMLLLRDRFVQMMRDYLKEARRVDNPRALYGFRKLVEPSIWDGTNPLGLVEVLDPATLTGRKLAYAQVIERSYLKTHFSSRIAAESFLQAKTREALDRYLEAVASSLAHAESLHENDVAGLLKLTSASFDAVVESLLPGLLAPIVDANSGNVRWEPDMVARGHVKGIANLGAQLRAQGELAAADKNVVLAVASLPLVVAPASLLTTVLSLALGAVDVVDAATNLALDQQDANFAMGSSAVLGMDSINMAELERTPLWANVVALAAAAMGMKADVLQAVRKVSLAAAIPKADSLLSRLDVDKGSRRAFEEMSETDQAEIIALIGDATLAARKAPNDLTPLQRRLLDAGDRLIKDAQSPQVATTAPHGPTGTSIAPRPPSAGAPRPAGTGGDFAADLRTPEGRATLDREIAEHAKRREQEAASGAPAPAGPGGGGDLFGRPGFSGLPSKPRAEGPELEGLMTAQERAELEARARAETQPLPAAPGPVTGPTGTSIVPRPPSAGGPPPAQPGSDFAADLKTPEGRAELDRQVAEQARLREQEAASGAPAPSPAPGSAGDLFAQPGFRDLPSKPRAESPDVEKLMTAQERAELEARARAETQPLPAAPGSVTAGPTGTSAMKPAAPAGDRSGMAPRANELLDNLRGADPRLKNLDVEAARQFIRDHASRSGATPESLLVEAARAQQLNVNPRLLSEAAGIDFNRARDLVTQGRPRTATAEPPAPIRETPPASSRPSFVPERNQTLHEIIDAHFRARDKIPALHVTDRASLERITSSKTLQQPERGGASWSPAGVGTLREGNVAIRIKPGHEAFIEFRRDPNGLIPIHWPSGKRGVGRATSYIPTDRLQWLDSGSVPGQERWVDFTPASKK